MAAQGTVGEVGKVIQPLTDPVAFGGSASDAFHVVCPTLPGFGFSDKAARPGWGTQRIANVWDQLMARLGYSHYGAQGGDWGSQVTTALGVQYPEHVIGIHLNMVFAFPDPGAAGELTDREREALAGLDRCEARPAQGSPRRSLEQTEPHADRARRS